MTSFNKSIFSVIAMLIGSPLTYSQSYDTKINSILQSKIAKDDFQPSDLQHFKITDAYTDEKFDLTYVYAQQNVGAIPIDLALANFIFKKGQPVYSNLDRWVRNVNSQVQQHTAAISSSDAALVAVTNSIGKMYLRAKPKVIEEQSAHQWLYQKMEGIIENIPVQLVYRQIQNKLVLYWKVGIHEADGDYWENYIDATTGNVFEKKNQTLACGRYHDHHKIVSAPALPFNPVASQYRVWSLPASAPNDGPSNLVSDPSELGASPMGWHNDGATEYAITRGNNVHAFADPDSNYISAGDEPTGGVNLVFDYPYNPSGTLVENKSAGVVNLFYMNNVMHDFAYQYGLTEQGGNYQVKNFTGKGKGNDGVIALAQYGANNSRIRNNADFLPPADGSNGRMRMFVWNVSGSKLLKLTEPASLATEFETGTADFGIPISSVILSGKLALVSDGSSTPTLGCKALTNAAEVRGKIALIDRGDCFFHQKACFAQNAGAIAVIIANYENTPNSMAAVSPAPCNVTIPVISVGSVDGNFLKKNIQAITIAFQKPTTNGSLEKDASFDNGIIAHEYGHGISTRLAGGPSNSGCLGNDEQMGEGWSDFFTLVTTIRPGETELTTKGVGTFPLQQEVSGRGIRKYPYTLDFSINDQTYEDIFTTETPHALGEIWTLMLWEMYWKMSKKHGWDPDLYKGNGGNNKAIRLVFEGLKIQPCSPGFIDGRDAILQADQLLYNGENQCIIWEAFARRGLGLSAKQGSATNRADGIEAYDMPPNCIATVKINKEMTPSIKAGDDITVRITVRNDTKTTAKNVVVNDLIPAEATFIPNSSEMVLTQAGNTVQYIHPELLPGGSISITYKLKSSKSLASKTHFIDSMENTEFNYDVLSLEGSGIWEITDAVARSGKKSWHVPNLAADNDQTLNPFKPFNVKDLKQPVMRFYHRYNIQHAFDGGILRVSTDQGSSFTDLGKKIFRNSYSGPLSYFAIPIPELRAFYGDSKVFIPTYIDLTDYKNQEFYLQFRFGSNNVGGVLGWFIDDLEIFDMFNYNSEACVSYEGGTTVCAQAPAKGTIVEPQLILANRNESITPIQIQITPNPAHQQIYVWSQLPKAGTYKGEVYTLDGRLQHRFTIQSSGVETRTKIDTQLFPTGMYIVKIAGGNFAGQQKFVIQH